MIYKKVVFITSIFISLWCTDKSIAQTKVSGTVTENGTLPLPGVSVVIKGTSIGGSAMLINKMSSSARSELLQELFVIRENDIGVSYLRISIGFSGLDATIFSYNDLPSGQTDENLDNFSLNPDMVNLVPVLNEILTINPNIKILALPWSASKWMKNNNATIGGESLPQYYNVFANYFVKYIEGIAAQGITIDTKTIQNEPKNPYNNPSLLMSAEQQKKIIRDHLVPLFATENINNKIILFDHNLDIVVLNNSDVKNI